MKIVLLFAALIGVSQTASAVEASKPLNPKYPVIEGNYRMTEHWALTLDQKHNRRLEGRSLVIWRPGFTIWTNVWNSQEGETAEEGLQSIKKGISPKATDVTEEKDGDVIRFSYRLDEAADDKRLPAFYGHAVGATGHVQISIYFDEEKDLEKAQQIFKSLTPVKPGEDKAPAPAPAEKPAQ